MALVTYQRPVGKEGTQRIRDSEFCGEGKKTSHLNK